MIKVTKVCSRCTESRTKSRTACAVTVGPESRAPFFTTAGIDETHTVVNLDYTEAM
jgi:hypothetical protein